jgi:hypothetical protein
MKKNKIIEWVVFLFAASPGLLFSYMSNQEPWALFRLAKLVLSIQQNQMVTYITAASGYRAEHLGAEFLETGLLLVSHWPAEWLGLLPIGSLFFVIIYYSLAYKLSQSRWMAILIAIYVGWYYPRLVSQYSVQTYVWTNTLFIGFLMVFIEWIKRRRIGYSVLIIILYVVTFLFYQTTPIWFISAIAVASILIYIKKRRHPEGARISWSLPMFCIVIYLTFDTILYNNFLSRVTSESTNQELLQNIASKIFAPLFGQAPTILQPFEVAPLNPRIATWMTLVSLIIMVVPLGYWFIVKVMGAIKYRDYFSLIASDDDIFIWSILAVALVHGIAYIAYGAISTRVIPLVFPFLLLIIPRSLRLPNNFIAYTSAFLLALTSIIGFISYIPVIVPDAKSSDLGHLASLIEDKATLLADGAVFGSLQINGAKEGKYFNLSWPDSEQYSEVVNSADSHKLTADFIVVDKYNKPVVTTAWVFLQPWENNIEQINQNQNLNKIYDSDTISLYQLKERILPNDRMIASQEGDMEHGFPWGYFLGMITAIILMLMLPGALLLLLIKNRLPMDVGGPLIFSSLSLVTGMGLITFAGYLANFSPLGLGSTIWVLVVFSLGFLAALIYFRKEMISPLRLLLNEFLFVITLIIVWSFLMTTVAQIRTNATGDYVEFFAMQDKVSGRLVLDIGNSLSIPESFTITSDVEGQATEAGPFLVAPDHVSRLEMNIPDQFRGKIMKVKLHSDNRPDDLTLHFLLIKK